MTQKDIERKQIVLIEFLREQIKNYTDEHWKIKAEYSTNDNDVKVITVQETTGQKVVFYGECSPLFNYYMIDVYGDSIQEEKNMSLFLGYLIGTNNYIDIDYFDGENTYIEKWQIMIKQFSNFRPIEYMDIRRIGYNSTMQCIVNKVASHILE